MEEVREILDGAGSAEEVNALVNSRSLDGFTPLMLAVSGGNARGAGSASRARTAAVARLLLANGAAATADAHSSKRRTAADYAEIHGSRDLAGEIRRAERMALIGNSSEAPREAHPGEGGQVRDGGFGRQVGRLLSSPPPDMPGLE